MSQLHDLPSDIEVLKNLDISGYDKMLQDYCFGSFLLCRLIQKGNEERDLLKEKIAQLEKDNEKLKNLIKAKEVQNA